MKHKSRKNTHICKYYENKKGNQISKPVRLLKSIFSITVPNFNEIGQKMKVLLGRKSEIFQTSSNFL